MPSLPTRLADIRNLLQALDWDRLSLKVEQEAHARLAIVGPVNSGKSTLFNTLKGYKVSAAKAIPGTTKGVIKEQLGPFTLVDTPGFGEVGGIDRADIAQAAAKEADVLLLVLDGVAGVRQSDYELLQALQRVEAPLIVALNKIDLLKRDLDSVVDDVEGKLGVDVIPISAKTGAGIGGRLLPAIVESHPWMVVALGRALPAYRRTLCRRLIRSASVLTGLIAAEPIPGLDIPLLLAAQVRLVLRIGAVYGESMSVRHAKELLTTMAGGIALRYLAAQLGKLIPGPGWLIGAFVTAIGTGAIGRVAMVYFESGKRLSAAELRRRYKRFFRHPRRGQ